MGAGLIGRKCLTGLGTGVLFGSEGFVGINTLWSCGEGARGCGVLRRRVVAISAGRAIVGKALTCAGDRGGGGMGVIRGGATTAFRFDSDSAYLIVSHTSETHAFDGFTVAMKSRRLLRKRSRSTSVSVDPRYGM